MVSTQLKNIRQIGSIPQVRVKIRKYLKPPPSLVLSHPQLADIPPSRVAPVKSGAQHQSCHKFDLSFGQRLGLFYVCIYISLLNITKTDRLPSFQAIKGDVYIGSTVPTQHAIVTTRRILPFLPTDPVFASWVRGRSNAKHTSSQTQKSTHHVIPQQMPAILPELRRSSNGLGLSCAVISLPRESLMADL